MPNSPIVQKWVTANPPKGTLIPIDGTPVPVVNGNTMQRFVTQRGYWWAIVTYPSGFHFWVRLVTVR